jgi:hypothetical protein
MASLPSPMTIHDRVLAILQGRQPDRLPFLDRLELWFRHHNRAGTLPAEFHGMTLTEVHRAVGMGQQKFMTPYALQLRGVELSVSFEGQLLSRQTDPQVTDFPTMADLAVDDRPGVTSIELTTPLGRLRVQHEILADMILGGTSTYVKEHLIKEEADYRTVEYVLERADYVPRYEQLYQEEARLADIGYVVPLLQRIPFQQVLLEYLGETPLFYALYDNPAPVHRLLELLDKQLTHILHQLADFRGAYVEFGDNLTGSMTNPPLFRTYCLPAYQRYADLVHTQGKKVGSHTDGDLRPLLQLLAECGLDVCESISPAPLTGVTFEEIWHAWRQGPLIWGGIPSPLLEERTSHATFRDTVQRWLELIDGQPIILGVGDMVLGNNRIERVRAIAELVEARPL